MRSRTVALGLAFLILLTHPSVSLAQRAPGLPSTDRDRITEFSGGSVQQKDMPIDGLEPQFAGLSQASR